MTHGRTVVCANAGDSRAILYNSAQDTIVELSAVHKPSDPAEQQCIQAAGGQARPPRGPPQRAPGLPQALRRPGVPSLAARPSPGRLGRAALLRGPDRGPGPGRRE